MSNQPQPTRNATVPAPPLRPVVSRSTNSVRPGRAPIRAGDEASGSSSCRPSPSAQLALADAPRAVRPIATRSGDRSRAHGRTRWSPSALRRGRRATRSDVDRRLVAARVGLVGQLPRRRARPGGRSAQSRRQIHSDAHSPRVTARHGSARSAVAVIRPRRAAEDSGRHGLGQRTGVPLRTDA